MSPFLRRLSLPLAAIFVICILLLSNPQEPQFSNDMVMLNHYLLHPTTHPFPTGSTETHHVVLSHDHGVVTVLDTITLTPASIHKSTMPKALLTLTTCPRSPNRFTGHVRLPNLLYDISMTPQSATAAEKRTFWNPTTFALPYWAKNQYIIVSMVAPHGEAYRRNVLCEANICHPKDQVKTTSREKQCTEEDLDILGPNGGLRCVTAPVEVEIPPTPAERCEGLEQLLADIPGFHDPRLLYSGRGEPILMVVSQSRYACIGLWAIDLRVVYPSIEETFSSSPRRLGPGPLMSYPTLTELTRNPASTRQSYEKNWVMFFPSPATSYLQYEVNSRTRTFAQLVGAGLTTPNMTDGAVEPCLVDKSVGEMETELVSKNASWHQATPALKLILCTRADTTCLADDPARVFFAAIQRKHMNGYGLPMRYERYFVVWSAVSPFNMLAVSQHPLLMANETNRGWTATEIWDDVADAKEKEKGIWGDFTYTTTIAYAWGRAESDIWEKGTGYMDDEVILSVGIDDKDGLYGKVIVTDLLQCLRV